MRRKWSYGEWQRQIDQTNGYALSMFPNISHLSIWILACYGLDSSSGPWDLHRGVAERRIIGFLGGHMPRMETSRLCRAECIIQRAGQRKSQSQRTRISVPVSPCSAASLFTIPSGPQRFSASGQLQAAAPSKYKLWGWPLPRRITMSAGVAGNASDPAGTT